MAAPGSSAPGRSGARSRRGGTRRRARTARTSVEKNDATSALRAESASRRRRARPRRRRRGARRAQAESDEQRGAAELGHGSARFGGRVLRGALRDHRARRGRRSRRPPRSLPVDDDVATGAEEVGDRALVDDRHGRLLSPWMSRSSKRSPPACASPLTCPRRGRRPRPRRPPASSLGETDGVPPPAIDVYSRNTASTAAIESAITSLAGDDDRATANSVETPPQDGRASRSRSPPATEAASGPRGAADARRGNAGGRASRAP